MDMQEHCSSDKKRVVVNSSILPFRDTGQVENPLPISDESLLAVS
jgi:hypothetical protein